MTIMAKNPFDLIVECIVSKTSFCFNSGAGSGKTYNLVKTIEYISEKYGTSLLNSNQIIMVITYTNAATNEIINRIGKSRICDISTIHTRLWDIIKRFQSDLLKLHFQKINEEIVNIESILKDNPYTNDSFLKKEIETNEDFINEFYKYNSLTAPEFKQRFLKYTEGKQITNVTNFKTFVSKTYKRLKLVKAKTGIEKGLNGFKKVEYDPFDNSDKLYKMKFSHDTLIEYSSAIFNQNKTIRKIISDKYPYILIDEYQDTSENVVKSFGLLIPETIIGFYGDDCQNIYSDGVGGRLKELLPELCYISNPINRRSASKIVDLGNRIRNDDSFRQIPFSQDSGSVEIYYSKSEDDQTIDSFISKTISEFCDSKVNFFLLKNEQVANKNEFGTFYSMLRNTNYYKNNYNQAATEILSDDETKLGKIPHNFYQILRLRYLILNDKKPISDYVPDSVYGNMNLNEVSKLVDSLKKACECETLRDLVNNYSSLFNKSESAKLVFEKNISDCFFSSLDHYKSYLFENLFGEIAEDKITEAQVVIDSIMSATISEINNWYNYISRIDSKPVNYFTFHGTKGLEFENVGVIITNSFDRKNDYYHSFFKEISCEQKSEDFMAKKNLLYVSMTRAKKNLRVLYVDSEFDSIADNFKSVFGECNEFIE